jgi:purine-binding chemotaxis protein CheW
MTRTRTTRYSVPTPARSQPAVTPRAHRLTPLGGSVIVPGGYTPDRTAPSDPPAPAPFRTMRERARMRTGSVEVLVFRVGAERFGVELAAVEEAIDLDAVHHVPEMPPAMLGVTTVRGALTPVYSPQASLGLALVEGTSALVFRRGETRYALVIDDVDDVVAIDLTQLRDAPGTDSGDGVLLGVMRTKDSLLALVDADALLAACSIVPAPESA